MSTSTNPTSQSLFGHQIFDRDLARVDHDLAAIASVRPTAAAPGRRRPVSLRRWFTRRPAVFAARGRA